MKSLIIYLVTTVNDGAVKVVTQDVLSEDNSYGWLDDYKKKYPEDVRDTVGVGKTFKSVDGTQDLTLVRFELGASSIGRAGDGEFIANALSSLLNVLGGAEQERGEEFVSAMVNEHRTLQQSFMRLVVMWIRRMATARTDHRNEASADLARTIVKKLPEKLFLPMI